MTNPDITTCLNCGEKFSGDYCPHCGQKAATARLTVASSLKRILSIISSMDSTFFRTMGNLFWRPGHMVRDFLQGKRVRYVNPVTLLSSLVAIYLFVAFIFGFAPGEVHILQDEALAENVHSDSLSKLFEALSAILSNKIVNSLVSAFICLLPFSLMFKGKGLNLAEHFCALLYCACLEFCLSLLFRGIEAIGLRLSLFAFLDYLLYILIPVFVYKQMLGIGWWSSLWRSFIAIILTWTAVALLVILTFGIFYGVDAIA